MRTEISPDSPLVRRLAEKIVGTGTPLSVALVSILGYAPVPDLVDEIETALLCAHNLFRCPACAKWLNTKELAPESQPEICTTCFSTEWEHPFPDHLG